MEANFNVTKPRPTPALIVSVLFATGLPIASVPCRVCMHVSCPPNFPLAPTGTRNNSTLPASVSVKGLLDTSREAADLLLHDTRPLADIPSLYSLLSTVLSIAHSRRPGAPVAHSARRRSTADVTRARVAGGRWARVCARFAAGRDRSPPWEWRGRLVHSQLTSQSVPHNDSARCSDSVSWVA